MSQPAGGFIEVKLIFSLVKSLAAFLVGFLYSNQVQYIVVSKN